jgi:hypothetical protein
VSDDAPFGVGEIVLELAGGTPAKATGTVAPQLHCSGLDGQFFF